MSVKFNTIVSLSDKTAIQYSIYAESKAMANKAVIKLFGYRKVLTIQTHKA